MNKDIYLVDDKDKDVSVWKASNLVKNWDIVSKNGTIYSTIIDEQGEIYPNPKNVIKNKSQLIRKGWWKIIKNIKEVLGFFIILAILVIAFPIFEFFHND